MVLHRFRHRGFFRRYPQLLFAPRLVRFFIFTILISLRILILHGEIDRNKHYFRTNGTKKRVLIISSNFKLIMQKLKTKIFVFVTGCSLLSQDFPSRST